LRLKSFKHADSVFSRVDHADSQEVMEQYSSAPTLYQRLRLSPFVKSNTAPKRALSGTVIGTVKDLVIYTLAFWGLLSSLFQVTNLHNLRAHNPPVHAERLTGCDCGKSVEEAVSLGCKFDALSMAWLPEHCRDDELTAEFDTVGDGPNGTWLYFADTEHKTLVDVSRVAAMGDDPSARVHMDKTWHRVHCVYYWLKLFRTRENGKIIEPRSDTEGHIRHCGKVFADSGYGTISGVALNTNELVVE
jgi:hypothetical protein